MIVLIPQTMVYSAHIIWLYKQYFCQFLSIVSIATQNFTSLFKGILILVLRYVKSNISKEAVFVLCYDLGPVVPTERSGDWGFVSVGFSSYLVPPTSCRCDPLYLPSASPLSSAPQPPCSPRLSQSRACCFISSLVILAAQQGPNKRLTQ